jgi:hypothetical protein
VEVLFCTRYDDTDPCERGKRASLRRMQQRLQHTDGLRCVTRGSRKRRTRKKRAIRESCPREPAQR